MLTSADWDFILRRANDAAEYSADRQRKAVRQLVDLFESDMPDIGETVDQHILTVRRRRSEEQTIRDRARARLACRGAA